MQQPLKLNIPVFLFIGFILGVLFTSTYLQKYPKNFRIERQFIIRDFTANVETNATFDRCGKWQQNYRVLHQSILNGTLPSRYLVSVAVEAGLADRLTGTLTEFFFALLTNRAFQIITYGTLPRFEAALSSPNINWSRPTDPDHLIDNLKYTYKGIRGYLHDRSYSSEINTNLYWPMYLINDDHGNSFFLSSNVTKYPLDHENVETLFVASNHGRIVRLFDNPYHRSKLFQMGLRPETAAKCAFDFLFSPTESVKNMMKKEFAELQSIDVLKIAINIRVGDEVFDPNADEKVTLEPYIPYFVCASNIESFARVSKQRVIWYVTSDSLKLRQLAKQRYGEKVLTEEKIRYVHGDCGDSDAKRYGNCTKNSQDFSIQMAVGQILAISMCDYHVVSEMSGFGRFSSFLSNHWHSVYQIHLKNRSCTLADSDSLEVLSTVGSGI